MFQIIICLGNSFESTTQREPLLKTFEQCSHLCSFLKKRFETRISIVVPENFESQIQDILGEKVNYFIEPEHRGTATSIMGVSLFLNDDDIMLVCSLKSNFPEKFSLIVWESLPFTKCGDLIVFGTSDLYQTSPRYLILPGKELDSKTPFLSSDSSDPCDSSDLFDSPDPFDPFELNEIPNKGYQISKFCVDKNQLNLMNSEEKIYQSFGIYLFQKISLMAEFYKYCSTTERYCYQSILHGEKINQNYRFGPEYRKNSHISFESAILEKTINGLIIPIL